MAITDTRVAELKQLAESERDRRAYPDAFPVLPPVPAARYVDREFARLEHEAVFRRSWLMVAHADQLREPGDFLLVEQLPEPVLLVRTAEGAVKAHYNTCKHRGAELVDAPCGNAGRRLTCPYHSWVYDLDGRLVGYPDSADFTALDDRDVDLTAVRCETWGPLVFVNLDPDAAPLAESLEPVWSELAEMAGLDGALHLAGVTVREVPVNWKLPVDANIETYHVNTVHRSSAAKVLDQGSTGIQLLPNGHSRMLISVRQGVPLTGKMPFPPLFHEVGDLPDSGTFSYHLFPNFSIVFVGKGFLFLVTNWPIDESTSRYQVHWCSSLSSQSDDGRAANETFIRFNQEVLFEDLSVLPGLHRSLRAGGIAEINLSYQERRIYHVHEAIDRAIGAERVPEGLRVPAVLGPFIEGRRQP